MLTVLPSFLRTCALPILLLMLAACQQSDLVKELEQIVPLQDKQLAMHYSELLREKQLDPIRAASEPGSNGDDIRNNLATLSAAFPASDPESIKVVGYQRFEQQNAPQLLTVVLEYAFPKKWLLTTVVLRRYGNDTAIIGLHIQPITAPLEAQATFSFKGKSFMHYAVLCAALTFPLLSLYALVACLRSKLTVKKWPWILFIIVGFGKLTFNWGTGQWLFLPIAFQVLSVSAGTTAYTPWMFGISFPLGALIFLTLRKRLKAPETV